MKKKKLKKRVAELEAQRNILLDQINILVFKPESIEALPIKMAVRIKKAQDDMILYGSADTKPWTLTKDQLPI